MMTFPPQATNMWNRLTQIAYDSPEYRALLAITASPQMLMEYDANVLTYHAACTKQAQGDIEEQCVSDRRERNRKAAKRYRRRIRLLQRQLHG